MMATVTPTPSTAPEDVTSIIPRKGVRARPLFDPPIVKRATRDSFVKLNPRAMMKNPVMFVVEVGALVTTILAARDPRLGMIDVTSSDGLEGGGATAAIIWLTP